MKLPYLAILAIAILISGCNQEITSTPTTNETPATKTATKTATTASVKSGNFQKSEQPTQGKVSIVTDKGKRYLEFDQSFKTNEGPDLYVILYRGDKPPISGIKEKDYQSIAKLKNLKGTQRYELPEQVKLSDFRSVAIWCRKFNATFGYASLPAQ